MTKDMLYHLHIPEYPDALQQKIKDNWNSVAKPLDGLGRLETFICRIGAAQETQQPSVKPRALVIMCADNGVVEEGVSQSGQEVTLAVARNMGMRMSSACKMAAASHTDVIPVDIGIHTDQEIPGVLNRKVRAGTRNFLKEPAMSEEELLGALETGISIARECRGQGYRVLATGEMGIGNTTTSAAVTAALLHLDAAAVAGRGAGLNDAGLKRKTAVIEEALRRYGFDAPEDPAGKDLPEKTFRILQSVGGLDIAGLCGVFIGGALYRIPVVIDGVISASAALCAERLAPGCRHFMLASHMGAEPAMQSILKALRLEEVIHADLALGEGTGALMLFPLLDMAMEVYNGSSSFADIGVEQYRRYQET